MKHAALLALLLVFSCKNDPAPPPTPAPGSAQTALPEDFSEFYQRFHTDSAFQMERVVFPLKGFPDHADSLTIAADTFHWQRGGWLMQRPVDFQMSEFERELIPVNEMMVVERIVHKSGETGMTRRFAKVAGEWHLIWYAGMNKLAK